MSSTKIKKKIFKIIEIQHLGKKNTQKSKIETPESSDPTEFMKILIIKKIQISIMM